MQIPDGTSTAELAALVTGLGAVVWEGDSEQLGRDFVAGDPAQVFGCRPATMPDPYCWLRHIHPADRDRFVSTSHAVARDRRRRTLEYRLITEAGHTRWCSDSIAAIASDDGTVRLRGMAVATTDRHEPAAEPALSVGGEAGPLLDDEAERRAHLWFLEGLREIDATLRGGHDLGRIIQDMCETVRRILSCDRVWLLDSVDDDGTSWRMACNVDAPGAPESAWPMTFDDAGMAACLSAIRTAPSPVQRGPGASRDVPHLLHTNFHVRSLLGTAMQVRGGSSLVLVALQCSEARAWSTIEAQLLEEIGRRLADTTVTVSAYLKLRDSERRLAESQRMAHVGYWERDFGAGQMRVSEETLRICGHTSLTRLSDKLAMAEGDFQAAVHPGDRARVGAAMQRSRATGAPYDEEYRLVRPDGDVRDVRSLGTLVRDADGTAVRMFGALQDITELRRAERELHAVESRFRTLVDHASDAFFVFVDNRIVDVNAQAVAQLGYTREELLGMSVHDIDPSIPVPTADCGPPPLADDESVTIQSRHRRKDGTLYPVELRISMYTHDGQQYVMCLARDVSERVEAEQRLHASHALMEAIISGTPDIMYVLDRQHRCVMINPMGAKLLEMTVEEMVGRPSREVYPRRFADDQVALDEEVMRTGAPRMIEGSSTFNGVRRSFTTSKYPHRNTDGEIIGLIAVTREMTDYKRLEEQLVHSQKMEAVGQLAGGVAHDFNNLLTVIISYSELLLSMLRPEDSNRELVTEIRRCGERAATLTSQLLTFSRKQRLSPRIVNLYSGIGEWRRLVRPLVREDIAIVVDLAPNLHPVRVDPDQLEQALTNLVVNARDAMPDGGTLRVAVDEVVLTEETARLQGGIAPGRYARITVTDSGQGIPEANLARVFEPFFTTKGVGKGTGLGLSMVYGFVRQSGGDVSIRSEAGVGTTVSMVLPAVDAPADRAPTLEGDTVDRGGSETVLLVEDERMVRTLSRRILESVGYTVLEAFDGEEALAVARAHVGRIDIVVTDVIMPRLNGRKMAEALRLENPQLKVLFVSGYAGDMAGDPTAIPPIQLLQKPFTPAILARRVRELLDLPASTPASFA